jgi:hypothetical protein
LEKIFLFSKAFAISMQNKIWKKLSKQKKMCASTWRPQISRYIFSLFGSQMGNPGFYNSDSNPSVGLCLLLQVHHEAFKKASVLSRHELPGDNG